ncbi:MULTISPECIES: BACON domain-containing protein [unclassified Streptomyces]|uniref:BACON domain-containing protein n=1 Tax=unclassified Streptomyces TaxID=2593676 RepID=UPI0004C173A6|nr:MULTISPECIES: sigma-70 family RNA polymerase sigma factor [unclassified Streptomyces]
MMSSTPEISTRTAGAHRAHREARDHGAARTLVQRPPTRYEPYLDGLFTYCLSVLCDHDAATAALGDALALAERRGRHVPDAPADRRAWLYALARWACLRKLAEAKQKRTSSHAAGRTQRAERPAAPAVSEEVQERRRDELALLAWPEAAGTTPEQREALELAVRHHLAAHEVAAVLGMDLAAARDLLASAACEVERTRAALAVVETGACPSVAHLVGDDRLVLGTALRRELVRHVDDCPRCRRTAERAIPGRWPGTSVTPAALPVLPAPRAAVHVAMAHPSRARGAAPRFDRRGFPMDPKDRAARRDRLRARAITTTVVATVVAAPVLALWAAYRGTPVGEGQDGRTASAREADDPLGLDGEVAGGGYENAGNASTRPGPRFGKDGKADVSVEVLGVAGAGKGAARLEVTAGNRGDTTLVTLTATGSAPVRWSAATGADWLYLSRTSGTLRPGESLTIKVYVDHLREPSGPWRARVAVSPVGAVVHIEGYGTAPSPSGPGPRPDPRPTVPSDPPSSQPEPTPTPSAPDPTTPPASPDPDPTPTDPAPSDPTDPADSAPPPPDGDDPSPATS